MFFSYYKEGLFLIYLRKSVFFKIFEGEKTLLNYLIFINFKSFDFKQFWIQVYIKIKKFSKFSVFILNRVPYRTKNETLSVVCIKKALIVSYEKRKRITLNS